MNNLCRAYAPFLRELHPALALEYLPNAAGRGVLWVTFAMSPHRHIKLYTLDALLSGERHGPGAWIRDRLHRLSWEAKVWDAKQAFARSLTMAA